jgi:hypothetical protein
MSDIVVYCIYIYSTKTLGGKNNVTSGGVRCSKWTSIYIKKTNPSSINKEVQRKEKRTKVLTLNKYMAMGPSGARCQMWACRLIAGSKLLLLLLLGSWEPPREGGFEYLHRSPTSHRRRRKGNPVPGGISGPPCSWGISIRGPGPPGLGSLESETVTCGQESRGTGTREWLRWRGPAAIVKDRPVLSSEREPHINKPQLTEIKIWSWAPDGCLTPRQIGWLTVVRNITLNMTLTRPLKFFGFRFCIQRVKRHSYRHGFVVRKSPASKDLNPEAEESAALGVVTKQRLVKREAREGFVCAIVNCRLCKLALSL